MTDDSTRPTLSLKKIVTDTNVLIIFCITLMTVLGVSSITPAFPKVIRHFNLVPRDVGLLITAFTLPGVFLTLFLGVLADRIGRKVIIIPSLFLFGIAGTACFFATSFTQLVVLRFFQGTGAAALGVLNTTLVGDLFQGRNRTAVMGVNSSVLSIGTASYPAIGGLLATFAWNYPFVMPILAIPIGLFVLFRLRNPEPKADEHIKEYLANALKSIHNRRAIILFVASLMTFVILYGPYLTYIPLLLDHRFGSSPLVIGLLMSAASLAAAVTATQLGRLTARFSESGLIKTGFGLYAVVMALIPLLPEVWMLFFPALIFGVAQGINIPSIFSLLTAIAPLEYRAAFMAVNGMVLRLGQTLGPLVIGASYVLWAINGAFFAGASLAALMTLFLIATLRRQPAAH